MTVYVNMHISIYTYISVGSVYFRIHSPALRVAKLWAASDHQTSRMVASSTGMKTKEVGMSTWMKTDMLSVNRRRLKLLKKKLGFNRFSDSPTVPDSKTCCLFFFRPPQSTTGKSSGPPSLSSKIPRSTSISSIPSGNQLHGDWKSSLFIRKSINGSSSSCPCFFTNLATLWGRFGMFHNGGGLLRCASSTASLPPAETAVAGHLSLLVAKQGGRLQRCMGIETAMFWQKCFWYSFEIVLSCLYPAKNSWEDLGGQFSQKK